MRGTTSDSAFSRKNALTASNNAIRGIGRTRLSLLCPSGKPLREVFGRVFPPPRTSRQLSGGKVSAYFIPSPCLPGYPSKDSRFCQVFCGFYRSISSALFSVVSVIFVPPMIRASSRFRPSLSKGMTEVNVRPSRSDLVISRCVSARAANWGR